MSTLTGTPRLIRLALRRDRILLPVWILSIAGLASASIASVFSLYATDADRLAGAQFSAANPMTRVFDGPASGTTIGAMAIVEAYKVLAILVALMSSQAVVRHTRQDEETGRAELLGSAVVGRHARLTAALVLTFTADIALGLTIAALLRARGLPLDGSLATALAVAGVGAVFAGVAAVTTQIASTARAATSAAAGVLGIAFVLRAVGDSLGHVTTGGTTLVSAWPSWLSPFGWGQQVRPFAQDNWAVGGLFAGCTLLLVVTAVILTGHRDLGAGMIPARSGPAHASRSLRTPLGLAWRLQRTGLLTWVVALGVAGVSFGAVGTSVEEILGENSQMADVFRQGTDGGSMVDLYFTFMVAFIGIAAGACTLQALLRMRAEEVAGRLEPVLATPLGRRRWLAGHVLIAAGGTTAAMLVSELGAGLVYGALSGDWKTGLSGPVTGALVQVPAALALGGLVIALVGLLPRWSGALAWAALAASLVMGQLGALFRLPQGVLNLSPFTHVPRIPAEPFTATPVLALLAAAVVLAAVGFTAFRRRDLAIGA